MDAYRDWFLANGRWFASEGAETRDSPTALGVAKVSTAFALFSFPDHREKLRPSKNNGIGFRCACVPRALVLLENRPEILVMLSLRPYLAHDIV
jgi:hypothetical protein